LAYTVETGRTLADSAMSVVLDGQIVCTAKTVANVSFSPDGKRIAYLTTTNARDVAPDHLFVDNKELSSGDHGVGPVFSPDSQHFAYATINRSTTTSPDSSALRLRVAMCQFAVDAVPEPPVNLALSGAQDITRLILGSSNGHDMDTASANEQRLLDLDIATVTNQFRAKFQSSDDYRKAQEAVAEAEAAMNEDFPFNTSAGTPEQIRAFNEKRAQAQTQYVAARGTLQAMDRDFQANLGTNPDYMAAIDKLNADHAAATKKRAGIQLAIVAESSRSVRIPYHGPGGYSGPGYPRSFVSLNGQSGQPHDEIGDVAFSPDGSHLAYSVADYHPNTPASILDCRAITDNQQGPIYSDVLSIIFSPDSQHLAYTAIEQNHAVMILDGQSLTQYNPIIPAHSDRGQSLDSAPACRFDAAGNLLFLGVSNGGIYRINWKPDGALPHASPPQNPSGN